MSSIKVGVRARPLGYNELRDGCQSCVNFPGGDDIIIGGSKQFTFDYVFSDNATQEQIYDSSVKDIIDNLFIGYNVTVLAYGQTGSGKTYTMGTNCTDSFINSNSGIIPRTIFDIYKNINGMKDTSEISVKVSFIEVYKEEIFDLLSSNKDVRVIREENQDIKIPGLVEVTAVTADDVFKCLLKGSNNRAVGSTAMNETSSRSHAIFTMHFNIVPLVGGENVESISSKLHLVDLAGSERASKTCATGNRFQEGVNINMGLLALSNVISSLVERDHFKGRNKHVPYRQSKLTRLLQDSLGGNTKTLMLACISPADSNFDETTTTLNYAARARMIKNKPVVNKVNSAQEEIIQLRSQVIALKAQIAGGQSGLISSVSQSSAELTNAIIELNTKVLTKEREKLHIVTMFDEEISKRDEFMKKVWNKMVRENSERDEVYDELERFIKELPTKEEHEDVELEEEVRTEAIDEADSNVTKNNYLRSLREELKTKEKHLVNTEEDLKIMMHYEEKNQQLEQRIKDLEEEKVRKSQHSRKEDVEQQLKEARRQLTELQHLKREKDRKTEEVNQLRQKIDELKSSIVKVTKDMKKEKDMNRKITADRERQFKILLNRDRKQQLEIVKMAAQHAKEKAVYQKKFESMANEKRLKELAEKKVSGNRTIRRDVVGKNIMSQVKLWIRQVLDQAATQCETKRRVAQLIEKRRELSEKLTSGDVVHRAQIESEVRSLNECLSQQQAVLATASSHNLAVTANWNQLRNINECRVAIRYMFKQLVEEKVGHVMNDMEVQELRARLSALEEAHVALSSEVVCTQLLETQTQKVLKKRRTSILVGGSMDADDQPLPKRQKYSESATSEANSTTSALSEISVNRRSNRISQTCRCKTGCKPNRCGCLRMEIICSGRCGCGGDCSGGQLAEIPETSIDEVDENHQEEKENVCDRTFRNEVDYIEDDAVCNRTFENLDLSPYGDNKRPRKPYFPSLSNSRRNV